LAMKHSNKAFTPLEIPSNIRGIAKFITGFTLIELLLTVTMLAFCLCGILMTYINMFFLSDLSRDITLATNAVQAKMEEIKKTAFDNLSVLNGTTFDLAGFSGSTAKGLVEVTNTGYSDLKRARVSASFKSRFQTVGEDRNFNGVLNSGEDADANGRIDSPVELVTLITK